MKKTIVNWKKQKYEKNILSKFLSDYKFMSSFIRSLYD